MIFAWGFITNAVLRLYDIVSARPYFGISIYPNPLAADESMYLSDSSRGSSRTLTNSNRMLSFRQSKWLAFAPLFQNFFNTINGKLLIHAKLAWIGFLDKFNDLKARYIQHMISLIIYDKSIIYLMIDYVSTIAACDSSSAISNRVWPHSLRHSVGHSLCKPTVIRNQSSSILRNM